MKNQKSNIKRTNQNKQNNEIDENKFNYKKYRWFFTKSGKLVYGGKSAEQNEEVIRDLVKNKKNYIMMHTGIPGSPFSVIVSSKEKISEKDLEEMAIWTGCFSRAWRSGLKKTSVDIFLTEQLLKNNKMKSGTFGVIGKIDRKNVELKLVIAKQKNVLRAIPENSAKGKKYSKIIPGRIKKEEFAENIMERLNIKNKEEVLNALPTGGFKEI